MKRIASTLIAAAILIACNPATRPSVNVKIQVDPVDTKSTNNDDTSTGSDSTGEPNMSADLGVKTTIGPAVSVEVREPKK